MQWFGFKKFRNLVYSWGSHRIFIVNNTTNVSTDLLYHGRFVVYIFTSIVGDFMFYLRNVFAIVLYFQGHSCLWSNNKFLLKTWVNDSEVLKNIYKQTIEFLLWMIYIIYDRNVILIKIIIWNNSIILNLN